MSTTPTERDLEKNPKLTFHTPSKESSPHRNHTSAHARERLRHFLHPNGRRIHIASDPQHAEQLRKRLSSLQRGEEFDIYISGTPEHLEALRHAQTHHEGRRENLRQRYAEVFDQFENVHHELDALSNELDAITNHGVALDAHFDRFGYSAHIKSYEEESPNQSGTTTPRSSLHEKGESAVERGYASPLKLFKTPVVRQYFHKGILWRATRSEEVQSFELFVDLLYVGIIAINGDAASETPTGLSLLRFVITFSLSWKIWNDMAMIISWFETDDVFQRVSVIFLLACLFGYTTNIQQAFEHTYPTLIGFYLAARLYMCAYLGLVAWLVPMIRPIMFWNIFIALLGAALWIASIHVPYPSQLGIIWVALLVDICGHSFYIVGMVICTKIGPAAEAYFNRTFEFYPALNIEHRTERTNAFVTLVFGYTVVAILYQSSVNGIDNFYGKAILGLIQAFCFNWIYFEIDGSNLFTHAIRRHKLSAFVWSMSHLPFIMAFVLGGGALSRLVVAHDMPGARLEALTETYQARSEGEIPAGIRWFYCAGFAVALAFMGAISMSHVHKEICGLRFKKRYRLYGRFGVAIIMLCLPLAEKLNSLQLVGTMTALIVLSLGSELWASSCCNEKLMERSQPCKYFGECSKKDLQDYIRDGKEVNMEEVVSRPGGPRRKQTGITMVQI